MSLLVRLLLFLSLLLVSPLALAQEPAPSAHGMAEPAMVPTPRPALVEDEINTPRFRILYTKGSKGSAQALAERIEWVRDSFVSVLGRDWQGRTEIRIGRDRQEYEALALPGGAPPKWAVALAYPAHNIILLDARSLLEPEGHITLRHELAHVALGQFARDWPRWFQEGLAQHLAGERIVVTHYAALFRAVTQQKVLHFEDLAEGWPDMPADVEVAYAQSADFVAYLAGRHGPGVMNALIDGMARGEPFQMAFGKAFHSSLDVEEGNWRKGLSTRFGWLPLTTSMQLVWLVAPALCVVAYWRRRKQQAERLAAMAAEEAAEDAAIRLRAAEAAQQGLPALPPEELIPEWAEQPPPPEDPRDFADEESGEHGPRPPSKPTLH
ncbi:peptidase MA family metallohydrolase [Hyalangium versicolor]|uniref:peptidase MA family metallohydrolase n=1 Tax=Hyalangium versicolor TaxID=2861190 RepID=UPI002816808C|nr:peptidase MA family metallohydrolase [Hyalangium versicolor]